MADPRGRPRKSAVPDQFQDKIEVNIVSTCGSGSCQSTFTTLGDPPFLLSQVSARSSPPTDQNFLNFMQTPIFGKICMLAHSPGGMVPPPTGNPGSAPDQFQDKIEVNIVSTCGSGSCQSTFTTLGDPPFLLSQVSA